MRNRQRASALMFGIFVLATAASAQGLRSSLFINGAVFSPENAALQNKVGQGLGIMLRFRRHLTVSFEWKYARLKVDSQEGGLMNGELSYTPFVLSAAYHPIPESSFSPYLFGGTGFYLINMRPGARLTPEEAEIKTQKIKDGLGLSGGIGATVRLGSRLFLYVEGLYLWRRAKVETLFFEEQPVRRFTADFSAISALVGLKVGY